MWMKKCLLISVFFINNFFTMHLHADDDKKVQRIVFEEFQIKGKIRRPQLVLIKAEQRPKFTPMVMKSMDSEVNVSEFARDPAIEKSPYSGAFMFDGSKITNYEP